MFLVQKANLSSPFGSTTKKSSHVPKSYQLAARLFDEKVILHLKTLDLTENSSSISLSWLSAAVSFLSAVHTEAEDQISNLKSEADDFQALYMDYSMKVLDLCNLISSAVHRLTDRRLLMNFSLRLLNFTDQMPSNEKLNKAKDALARSVNDTQEPAEEKGLRAKALIEELAVLLGKLPRGKTNGGRDLIRRTFYGLGLLTLLVGGVLVTVMFGETSAVKLRVPAEFLWSDSVNGVHSRIFDLIKPKYNALLEIDNVSRQAVVVRDMLETVVSDGGDNADVRVRLEAGVKEMASSAKKFSDGIDGLTNGVNGLFRSVLKTRNGRLDV
ncbi:hypothetical protein L1987_39015 [Smallanthus sonchifolius]|uniref:Uncharacterized protein n=1 Tax=Smallanthus sonchifolius TaxID=185202 RepID=A0ACB9HNC4_9ASTR|nr:hypothetical protein L1987_39015 [Smallanthus sonchifolius]